MISEFINRLVTPSTTSNRGIQIASLIWIFAIFILDIQVGLDVRLRVLYVFPLTALAIHSDRLAWVTVGFILASIGEIIALISYHATPAAKIIDGSIGIAGFMLVVVLARTTRVNHLEALRQATHDALTELHNRRGFETIIDLEIARQKRYGGVFSLVAIDLDGFKELNDSRGHRVGDTALNLIADVLRKHTRLSDSIARIGGDEFAILMPNTKNPECTSVCRQMTVKIANMMKDAGLATSASIGCITFEQPPESTSDALNQADIAMYAVKVGKSTVVKV
jgi:diguanylate cyclase (GGDEF)-like protein